MRRCRHDRDRKRLFCFSPAAGEQRDVLRLTATSAISSSKIGMLRSEHSANLRARSGQAFRGPLSFLWTRLAGQPGLVFGRNSSSTVCRLRSGTRSSNPLPSSGESATKRSPGAAQRGLFRRVMRRHREFSVLARDQIIGQRESGHHLEACGPADVETRSTPGFSL